MKIGILTHHYVNNFGAFLQAYALREALAKEFPDDDVEIINYVNLKQFVINSGGWFRFYRTRENIRCWREKIRLPITFYKARKNDLIMSKRCFSARGINRLNYDVIVFGSDEIWNYQDKKSTAKLKFGHGITCKNKIAYAPSVGNSVGNIPQYVTQGLKKFSAISVRDSLTKELVQEVTGLKPTEVLDPTFLSHFPEVGTKNIKKPYILFYYCDHLPNQIKTQILEYARMHDLAVYGAGECDKRYDAVTVNLTPFQWAEMFRNAEFVFTGTFHGVAFSMLYRRQFKVYLTNKSRIRKVRALLSKLAVDDREMDENFVFDLNSMKNEIDFAALDALLQERRLQSLQYLHQVVENCAES